MGTAIGLLWLSVCTEERAMFMLNYHELLRLLPWMDDKLSTSLSAFTAWSWNSWRCAFNRKEMRIDMLNHPSIITNDNSSYYSHRLATFLGILVCLSLPFFHLLHYDVRHAHVRWPSPLSKYMCYWPKCEEYNSPIMCYIIVVPWQFFFMPPFFWDNEAIRWMINIASPFFYLPHVHFSFALVGQKGEWWCVWHFQYLII